MKKILVVLAMLCTSLVVVGATSPADATVPAGCGAEASASRYVTSPSGNYVVAGSPIRATMIITKRDCDGYDLITGLRGTVVKNDTGCTSIGGTGWLTDGYHLNPNVIGDANPPTLFINCVASVTGYGVYWNVYEKITSSMPESARCISMDFNIDVILHADWNGTTDSFCVNGL